MVYTLTDDYALRASHPGKFDGENILQFPTNALSRVGTVFPNGCYAASEAEYKEMEKAQEKDYEFGKRYEGFGLKEEAKALVDQDEIENIRSYLYADRKDDASEAFKEMIANLKTRPEYAKLSDKELRSMAKQIYEQTTGERISDVIDAKCSGGFWQGVCGGLTLGLCSDSKNADDLKEEMLGRKKSVSSKCGEVTGNTLGAAGLGAAIGTCFCPGPGTAIGAAIGGAVGFIKGLFS